MARLRQDELVDKVLANEARIAELEEALAALLNAKAAKPAPKKDSK